MFRLYVCGRTGVCSHRNCSRALWLSVSNAPRRIATATTISSETALTAIRGSFYILQRCRFGHALGALRMETAAFSPKSTDHVQTPFFFPWRLLKPPRPAATMKRHRCLRSCCTKSDTRLARNVLRLAALSVNAEQSGSYPHQMKVYAQTHIEKKTVSFW